MGYTYQINNMFIQLAINFAPHENRGQFLGTWELLMHETETRIINKNVGL